MYTEFVGVGPVTGVSMVCSPGGGDTVVCRFGLGTRVPTDVGATIGFGVGLDQSQTS